MDPARVHAQRDDRFAHLLSCWSTDWNKTEHQLPTAGHQQRLEVGHLGGSPSYIPCEVVEERAERRPPETTPPGVDLVGRPSHYNTTPRETRMRPSRRRGIPLSHSFFESSVTYTGEPPPMKYASCYPLCVMRHAYPTVVRTRFLVGDRMMAAVWTTAPRTTRSLPKQQPRAPCEIDHICP